MNDYVAKKKFGQNFLTDKNLLCSICADAGITKQDEVLEIGAGFGALTQQLCQVAKKVVAYEIDLDLKQPLSKLDNKNLILHFEDALKKDLVEIEKDFSSSYKLVANLPYYITSPIIFKFLESKKLTSLTVMVQKEVGERMVALPKQKAYGLLSASCAFFGGAKILRKVPRHMFTPSPDVDSCIVRLDINKTKYDEEKFFKVLKASFGMRRKTLLNNLCSNLNISKDSLSKIDFDFSKRAEEFGKDDFVELAKKLEKQGLI